MPPTKLQWAVRRATASFELDYDVCFCSHVDHISLPPFYAPKDDDLAWQITVTRQPNRAPAWTEKCNDGQWLSFRLSFKSSSGKVEVPIRRSVDISQSLTQYDIITSNLCKKHPYALTKESFSSSSHICFSNINASGEDIGSVYVCNKPNNKIVIDAHLTISDGTLSIENPPPQPPFQAFKKAEVISLRALLSSLDGLLQSGLMSDVTLRVEGHELRAHRSILAARSDVFKAMFASECRESASGIVKIEDIRLPVFKQFLRFIYRASLAPPARPPAAKTAASVVVSADGANAGARDRQQAADEDDYLMELLVAADKYLVEDLKAVCQGRLMDRLSADVDSASVKTLCDVLRAGHHLASAPLRQVGIGYLRAHRAAVLASAQWQYFTATNRTVAAEAMLDSMMPPPAVAALTRQVSPLLRLPRRLQ